MIPLFSHASDNPPDKEALIAELNLMRRVFESVTNGVTICDATADDLPLVYVNPAFERMAGYKSEEILGRNCRFLQRGESSAGDLAAVRQALRQGRDVRTVLKNYRKDGTVFWNELYLSPVFDIENRITHYVGIQHDITIRVELKRSMEHMALHDSLTGLANRSLAMDRLKESVERARRKKEITALLFIDLDGFKTINDRYGHQTGDDLLKAIGARLKLTVRASDCAARLGGDEFVVVASDVGCEIEAYGLRARVAARLEEALVLNSVRICPRASVGLSLYPRDGESAEGLLRAADLSMYLSKRERNERTLTSTSGEGISVQG